MIRIGFVSSIGTGGVSVTYPDTGKTTTELPVFEKDDAVVVAHMSNDNSMAVVLGKFYAGDDPNATINVSDGAMSFSDSAGSITLAEIIAK